MSEPAGAAIVDVAPKLAGPGAGAAGYSRSLSRLAAFTRWITAPWILLVIASGIAVQILTGTEPFHVLNQAGLEQAGHFGGLVATASMLDGANHVVFFVTWVAVFIAIFRMWPVRAALVLVLGAISLAFGLTKAITTSYLATTLGAAYLAEPTEQTNLLAVGKVADGLRAGLQDMDTYPPSRDLGAAFFAAGKCRTWTRDEDHGLGPRFRPDTGWRSASCRRRHPDLRGSSRGIAPLLLPAGELAEASFQK